MQPPKFITPVANSRVPTVLYRKDGTATTFKDEESLDAAIADGGWFDHPRCDTASKLAGKPKATRKAKPKEPEQPELEGEDEDTDDEPVPARPKMTLKPKSAE